MSNVLGTTSMEGNLKRNETVSPMAGKPASQEMLVDVTGLEREYFGTVWTTDKDGLIMNLLAAEITARTDKNPSEHFTELAVEFGMPYYTRVDRPATSGSTTSRQTFATGFWRNGPGWAASTCTGSGKSGAEIEDPRTASSSRPASTYHEGFKER